MDKLVPFRGTVRLLQLTEKCTEEERMELLRYISELENKVLDFQLIIDTATKYKNSVDTLTKRK